MSAATRQRTGKLGTPLRLSEDSRPEMIRNVNGSPVAEAVSVDVALTLIEYANERDQLRAALVRAIEVIEWCGQNDKTPTYGYGKGSDAQRPDGSLPGPGKAFNTPREFASWWPERLRDVLNGGQLDV